MLSLWHITLNILRNYIALKNIPIDASAAVIFTMIFLSLGEFLMCFLKLLVMRCLHVYYTFNYFNL